MGKSTQYSHSSFPPPTCCQTLQELDAVLADKGEAFLPFKNPRSVSSGNDGKLAAKVKIEAARVKAAGVAFNTRLFDGDFPGPTYKIRAGDKFNLTVVNELGPELEVCARARASYV